MIDSESLEFYQRCQRFIANSFGPCRIDMRVDGSIAKEMDPAKKKHRPWANCVAHGLLSPGELIPDRNQDHRAQ